MISETETLDKDDIVSVFIFRGRSTTPDTYKMELFVAIVIASSH